MLDPFAQLFQHCWGHTRSLRMDYKDYSSHDALQVPNLLGVVASVCTQPQGQKFHTDDVNLCLHNKSGSHGVPNVNLLNFTFLLVDFGKMLCSSENELQQNSNASSREEYIPPILTFLFSIHRVYS